MYLQYIIQNEAKTFSTVVVSVHKRYNYFERDKSTIIIVFCLFVEPTMVHYLFYYCLIQYVLNAQRQRKLKIKKNKKSKFNIYQIASVKASLFYTTTTKSIHKINQVYFLNCQLVRVKRTTTTTNKDIFNYYSKLFYLSAKEIGESGCCQPPPKSNS